MRVDIVGTSAVASHPWGGRVLRVRQELEPVLIGLARQSGYGADVVECVREELGYVEVGRRRRRFGRRFRRFARRIARRVKDVAKKVAQSKIVRAVAKVSKSPIFKAALSVIPGGAGVAAGISAVQTAATLARAAKRGNLKAAAALAVQRSSDLVRLAPTASNQIQFARAVQAARRTGVDPRPWANLARVIAAGRQRVGETPGGVYEVRTPSGRLIPVTL